MVETEQTLRQKAAAAILERRTIRRSLAAWGQHVGFDPSASHHQLIIRELEAMTRGGEYDRLGLFLPPGSAKSTWGNKLFIPWYLAQSPGKCILSVSHSDSKAEAFGRYSRNLVEAHADDLGYSLRRDSKAAGEWETTNDGVFFCAGVGTGIAGYRADFGLIDDPIGKKEDAMSKTIREKVWDWFNADFMFRLKPGAIVVLIQTRWHDADLAGCILPKSYDGRSGIFDGADGHRWKIISIPLIAEVDDPLGRVPGEALWQTYFTPDHIATLQKNPDFVPMCQQRPTPESGDFFRKEWFEDAAYSSTDKLPANLRYYAGSDHAVSQREAADRTCLIPAGVDSEGDLWIMPTVWWPRDRRPTPDEVVEEMLRLHKTYRFAQWWAGRDHITASLAPFIDKRSTETRLYLPFDVLSEARDKQTKAQPIRAMAKLGRVHLPSFAPWYNDAIDELIRFDKGTHDDFVDGLEKLGRGLSSQFGRKKEAPLEEPKAGPFRPTLGWVKKVTRAQTLSEKYVALGK